MANPTPVSRRALRAYLIGKFGPEVGAQAMRDVTKRPRAPQSAAACTDARRNAAALAEARLSLSAWEAATLGAENGVRRLRRQFLGAGSDTQRQEQRQRPRRVA